VPLLRPFLDVKTPVRDPAHMALPFAELMPPLRPCDAALEAILTILDGDLDESYKTARRETGAAYHGFDGEGKKISALRDRMIADLKKRLAGNAPTSPR
jgi:hypothetical protein